MNRLICSKLAFGVLSLGLGVSALAAPLPASAELTAARNLYATRSAQGYTLSGQLYSSNWCYGTRFIGYARNAFAAEQIRRPWHGGGLGPACVGPSWIPTSITVSAPRHPNYVQVRVQGGGVRIVPIGD